MCPPAVDHRVTILVVDAQPCYDCASIMQIQGWKDVLYPQFPYDCQLFSVCSNGPFLSTYIEHRKSSHNV